MALLHRKRRRRRQLLLCLTLLRSNHIVGGFTVLSPGIKPRSRYLEKDSSCCHCPRPRKSSCMDCNGRLDRLFMARSGKATRDTRGKETIAENYTIAVDNTVDEFLELDDAPERHTDNVDTIAVDDGNFGSLLIENVTAVPDSSITTLKNLNLESLAYFYLQNEVGMSEEAMWKITLEGGSVLGMTAKNLRGKVELLRSTMDLTDEDVRTILERHPSILHLSAAKNLAPTILFLVRALDLSKQDLRTIVVQYPCVLCYSIKNLKAKLNFFTKMMGYSKKECRDLFLAEPKLLAAGVKTGLLQRMHFFLHDIELPLEKLRVAVQKNPLLLLYSIEDNLVPKLIYYLTMKLHMTTAHLCRLLTTYPQWMDFNLDNHILPIMDFLQQDIGFSPLELRSILLKFPRLVTHSLRKVKYVVGFLRFELGMEASQVKRVLYQAPQVIGINTENNLKSKIAFLRETLELTDPELRRVLAGMPTLLICSVPQNLEPKLDYLKSVFASIQDLREAILTQPALLGYSLEKRIRPRLERLLAIGEEPRAITIGIPMKQDAFDGWLERKRERIKRKSAEQAAGALVHVGNKQEQDGRVMHWRRERRRPPQ